MQHSLQNYHPPWLNFKNRKWCISIENGYPIACWSGVIRGGCSAVQNAMASHHIITSKRALHVIHYLSAIFFFSFYVNSLALHTKPGRKKHNKIQTWRASRCRHTVFRCGRLHDFFLSCHSSSGRLSDRSFPNMRAWVTWKKMLDLSALQLMDTFFWNIFPVLSVECGWS